MGTYLSNLGYPDVVKCLNAYTGADFNATASGAAGNDTHSYEFTAVDAADLLTKNYLVVVCNVNASAQRGAAGGASSTLKIEHKDVGGAYSTAIDVTAETIVGSAAGDGNGGNRTITAVITLTAAEKNNGCIVKITGTSSTSGAGNATSITNVNTYMSAMR